MCGIFFLKSKVMGATHRMGWNGIINAVELLKTRGPDRTEIRIFESQVLGFCRLAINSISKIGDQPFCLVVDHDRRVSLIMNGEIYNHKKIQKKYKFPNTTGSDCEVMIHLYLKFGITSIIDQLDGVFAFTLIDGDDVYFGRDAIGVRPLYFRQKDGDIAIASTPLSLEGFSEFEKTKQVPAGSYYHFHNQRLDLINWYQIPRVNLDTDFNWQTNIRKVLINATKKRLLSDRPIGCLLSGGLDSSLIASILSRLMAPRKLQTFSIGFNKNATDILAARKVAKFLQTDHHEIILPMEKAFEAIPEVVLATGTYDITTIRASVGMYLICQWISQNTDIKVLFSGEGSDEIFCGYLYFHYAPTNKILEEESTEGRLGQHDVQLVAVFGGEVADGPNHVASLEQGQIQVVDTLLMKCFLNGGGGYAEAGRQPDPAHHEPRLAERNSLLEVHLRPPICQVCGRFAIYL